MAGNTYIIKFPSEESRSKFRKALEVQTRLKSTQMEFGEFLPDVIVRNISDHGLKQIKRLADPGARFIADFKHDLFRG